MKMMFHIRYIGRKEVKDLVVYRIGMQMFKNNLGFLPNAVGNLFTANATIHNYNTRNKHKLRAACGMHQYVYSTNY